MTSELQELRQRMKPTLVAYGVVRAAVFGSWARGDTRDCSDVDVLVEFEDGRTLLDLVGLQQDLTEVLGLEADVVTYRSLHPLLRDRILAEQVPVL